MSEIKDALFGFAAANGRLPCPASASATGIENPPGGGACANPWDGFLPGITLGVGPTDLQGYTVDSWGNRIRYAVSTANSSAYSTNNGIKNAWAFVLNPDLRVCNTAANIAANDCPAADQLTNSAVAIVFSTGKNGGATPTSADELANWTTSNDRVFVSATPSATYDDLIVWLSPNILYNRMISAGRLP